jgi:hypothetical protein
VIEGAGGTRFLLEAPQTIGVGARSGRKNLHRNVATESFVMRAVNDAHPARADLREDLVVRERLSDQGIHRALMVSGERRR